MNDEIQFGQYVRNAREASKVSLRKFAEKIEVTPTYLSKIERLEITNPPSEQVIRLMAKELKLDFDDLMILAGRIPSELPDIINERPREMASLLRTASKMSHEELHTLLHKMQKKDEQ